MEAAQCIACVPRCIAATVRRCTASARLAARTERVVGQWVGPVAVFISYSRKQFYVAEAVTRALEQQGVPAWLDVLEIQPGADWQVAIDQALAACPALVVLASRAAHRSAAVRYEVAAARAAGKPIYLAVIDNNPF